MDFHGISDKLSPGTFVGLFLRSFFIQGSFSVKYRQNTGFAFCLEPVGRALWKDGEDYNSFLLRHMEYYNGNPFMVTLVLGATARLEEMLKNGEGISERDISGFKKAVGAATGSVGDRFFWSSLRPFGLILGMMAAYFWGPRGALAVLGVFNVPNVMLRWYWLKRGYELGTKVVSEIQNERLKRAIRVMENSTAFLLSFMTAVLIAVPGGGFRGIPIAAAPLFAANLVMYRRNWSVTAVLLVSLGMVAAAGLALS